MLKLTLPITFFTCSFCLCIGSVYENNIDGTPSFSNIKSKGAKKINLGNLNTINSKIQQNITINNYNEAPNNDPELNQGYNNSVYNDEYLPYDYDGWYEGYGYNDYGRRYFSRTTNNNFISSNHYSNLEHIMNIGGEMKGAGRR